MVECTLRTVALLAALLAPSVAAGTERSPPRLCPGGGWEVSGADPTEFPLICEGAEAAAEFLAACGIPRPDATPILVVEALPLFCGHPAHGLYDLREGLITIASRSACTSAGHTASLFQNLDPDTAYRSIAAHEAAHAIAAANGLGADAFLEHEYIAGLTQFSTLDAETRARLIADLGLRTPVFEQSLNTLIYAFDPLVFAARAHLFFLDRPDGCAHLRAMVAGDLRLPPLPGE